MGEVVGRGGQLVIIKQYTVGCCGRGRLWEERRCEIDCRGSKSAIPLDHGAMCIVTSTVYDSIFPSRNSSYACNAFITGIAAFPSFRPSGVVRNRHKTFMFTTKQADCSTLLRPTLDPTSASKVARNISGPLQISWSECFLGVSTMVLDHSTITQPSCEAVMDGSWSRSSIDISAGRNRADSGCRYHQGWNRAWRPDCNCPSRSRNTGLKHLWSPWCGPWQQRRLHHHEPL